MRSTDKYFCQFGFIHCQFFRGRRQGRQPLNNHELFVRAWGWFMVNPTKGKESVTNSPSASYCLLLAELPESFKTPDEKPTASTAWEETHGTWGTVQNLKPKQESFFAHTDRPLRSLLGFFNFHVTST